MRCACTNPRTWLLALAAVGLLTLMHPPPHAEGQVPDVLRQTIAVRFPDVRWVEPQRLARWLEGDAPVVILDARAEAEYRVSHLRGAVRVDPDLEDVASLGLPRDARIVVYCSVGWRSGKMADRFQEAGYGAVFNLEGGIFRWANQGRPVFRGGERVDRVHPYDGTWGRMLAPRHRAEL